MKRLAAPVFWPILRKEFKWSVKPSPGPHPLTRSIPLLILIRDILRLAENAREAKRIIYDGNVLVDGKVRRDYRYPVGLMDVVSIPKIDLYVRIVPYVTKYMWYITIPPEDAKLKLVRIENKTLVKGNRIQLNLHDGRNIVISREDAAKYRTLDTLLIEVPSQNILNVLTLEENKFAIVIDGKNAGRFGRIISINEQSSIKRRKRLVTIEEPSGHRLQTILNYIMVVGDEKPLVKLYEGV